VNVATATQTVLHLGSGRVGRNLPEYPEARIITLDADARLGPDLVCALGHAPIRLANDSVDVAVAHHVLEHIGWQGDTNEWFYFWEDLYRVLKPGGLLKFESPLASSTWAWADPSHTRALSPESFVFFDQDSYRVAGSNISPFRIRCDFERVGDVAYLPDVNPVVVARERVSHFSGTLRARKPLRPWWETKQ
jgi:SAM-dependent methyltransferase